MIEVHDGKRFSIGEAEFVSDTQQSDNPEKKAHTKIARAEREVFSDAQERFNATLEQQGLEFVDELENGYRYPSVDAWIESQLDNGRYTRYYPAFVRNSESRELFFVKARIQSNSRIEFGGLANEGNVLQYLPKEAPIAHFVNYIPEDEKGTTLEMLVLKAVKVSEGSVFPAKEWTSAQGEHVAKEIKKLEKIEMSTLPELSQEPAISLRAILELAQATLSPDFRAQVDTIIQAYEPQMSPVLIHGDTWIKNIIVSRNPDQAKTVFVDWERGGAGYRGQDIARLWWNLWENPDIREVIAKSYLNETDEISRGKRADALKFGVMFEALRWIADRNDQLKRNPAEAMLRKLESEIILVQQKAQAMIDAVTKHEDTNYIAA